MSAPPAIVLAAGEGSRLRPLTDTLPKPLLPIDGVAVIARLINQLRAEGVTKFIVVIGYHGDLLRTFLQETFTEIQLHFVEQPERLGSADALQRVVAAGHGGQDAIVAASDTAWRQEDVASVLEAWRTHGALVTMGLRRWPVEQLPHRSCATTDDTGRVLRVIEKPTSAEVTSGLAGSPFYVFAAGFWPYVEAVRPANGLLELAVALQAAIDSGGLVQGVEMFETRDITRPADLLRFNFPYLGPYLS